MRAVTHTRGVMLRMVLNMGIMDAVTPVIACIGTAGDGEDRDGRGKTENATAKPVVGSDPQQCHYPTPSLTRIGSLSETQLPDRSLPKRHGQAR